MTLAQRVPHRGMITACIICATLLQSLDQTIANVALPYMQGSFSASYDEITWVLTTYITAAAIMTAPVGWLAARFGRKRLFVTCIIGFTITSMLCGAAQTLEQIVAFRLMQGGAAPPWCRCRRRSCSTSIRLNGAALPWRSGAWA
jgi:MFS transporter, DHA2 family, multidrug resistance protein